MSVSFRCVADKSYKLKSLKINNVDVTSFMSEDDYVINSISSNTTVVVEFEENSASEQTYALSIKASGNGSVSYNGKSIRNTTTNITINEGTTAKITLSPDNGYFIKSLSVNEQDFTASISKNNYTLSNIRQDTFVTVEFEKIPSAQSSFMVDGINYEVISIEAHTVEVTEGEYGQMLNVPNSVRYQGADWTVIGIAETALSSSDHLAAVIWEPDVAFNTKVDNPNLLLYVNKESQVSLAFKNVVVNGAAENIVLTEASSGNDFYCPRAFTAKQISYTHNYRMETGLGDAKGWETIALPFDVQTISHANKGQLIHFAKWSSDRTEKPFWLYELTSSGYQEADGIKANTPYIISMPNHNLYQQDYRLSGRVTFSAQNVEVKRSDEVNVAAYADRTFVPNFANKSGSDCLTLNVNNDYEVYQGAEAAGSLFVMGLRPVHPFEAYMTTTSNTRSIGVLDGLSTGIKGIELLKDEPLVRVYDMKGVLVNTGTDWNELKRALPKGVYIVNGKKKIIK